MAQITWQNVSGGQTFGDAGALFRDAAANITKGIKGVGEAVQELRTTALDERNKRTDDAISSLKASLQTPEALAQAQQELSAPNALETKYGNNNQVNISKIRDALVQQEGYVRDKFVRDFNFEKTKQEQQDFPVLEKIERDLNSKKSIKELENFDFSGYRLNDVTPAIKMQRELIDRLKNNEERDIRLGSLKISYDKQVKESTADKAIDPFLVKANSEFQTTKDKTQFNLSNIEGYDKLTPTQKLAAEERFNKRVAINNQSKEVIAQARQSDIANLNKSIKVALLSNNITSSLGDGATVEQLLDRRKAIRDLVSTQTDGYNLSESELSNVLSSAYSSSGITENRIMRELALDDSNLDNSGNLNMPKLISKALDNGMSPEAIRSFRDEFTDLITDPVEAEKARKRFESDLRVQEALQKKLNELELDLDDPVKLQEKLATIFQDTDYWQADAAAEAASTFIEYQDKYGRVLTNREILRLVVESRENFFDTKKTGDDFDPDNTKKALKELITNKLSSNELSANEKRKLLQIQLGLVSELDSSKPSQLNFSKFEDLND